MAITDAIHNNNVKERIAFDGGVLTDFASVKTLYAYTKSNTHSTPREFGASAGYTPPSGKRFRTIGIVVNPSTATPVIGLDTASSDVGLDSASTPSNTDLGGTVGNFPSGVASTTHTYDHQMILSAGRYFHAYMDDDATMLIVGLEEDVA